VIGVYTPEEGRMKDASILWNLTETSAEH
jgi:hypothetical protein